MADENNLNELRSLMQEIAKSTKSMADDMQKQTSRQEKLLLNQAAKNDAKRTEEFHKEQQDKLQGIDESSEEQRNYQEETLKVQLEILNQQKKNEKKQATASDYLKNLAEITEKNREELRNIRDESSKMKGIFAKTTRGLVKTQRVTSEFAESDSTLGGFKAISGIAGALGGATALTKMGIEGVTGFKSRARQKNIKKQREAINKEQLQLSAQMTELEDAKREGDEKRAKAARKEILRRRKAIKKSAESLSIDLGEETFIQQQKRLPRSARTKMRDADFIIGQAQQNIEASVMRQSGLMGKGSLGGGGQARFQASEMRERGRQKQAEDIVNQPVSIVSGPSTYGEFVAGTYGELRKLNEKIDEGKLGGDGSGGGGGGGGGGFFSTALGLLSSLGPLLRMFPGAAKGLFKMGKGLIKGIGNVGKSLFGFAKKSASLIGNMASKAFSLGKNVLSKGLDIGKSLFGKATTGVKGLLTPKNMKKAGGIATGLGKGALKAGKFAGKQAAKLIPGVGLALGLAGAKNFMDEGRTMRGLWEGASGIIGEIPVAGDLVSAGMDVIGAGWDWLAGDSEEEKLAKKRKKEADRRAALERLKKTDPTGEKTKLSFLGGKSINQLSTEMGLVSQGKRFNLQTGQMEDIPLASQSAFGTETTADTTGAASGTKITEYQMLAKMIAKENLNMQKSDAYKSVLEQQASLNAESTKYAFEG